MSSRRRVSLNLTRRNRVFPGRHALPSVAMVIMLFAVSAGANFFGSSSGRHSRAGSSSRLVFGLPQRLRLDGTELSSTPCLASTNSLLIPRGGALRDDDSDDYDDEEEWEEEDSAFDDDDDDDDMTFDFDEDTLADEADFAEDNTVDRMMAAWKKTPPLTKGYLTASAVATFYGYVFCGNDFPKVLLLDWNKVLTRLQIWRLFTSFLNFGPFGLGFLMTAQFVWVYMSTLERLNYSRPYDFWIMIVFGQLAMVLGYPIFNKLIPGFNLSPRFLGHNLSTFLVYIWSRYHEGIEVNMFELFNTRAELLPWFFLAQTFLLEGEPPILDFLGIVFGHIYHHCKMVGILRAPAALTAWYEESESAKRIREKYKTISSDFEVV